MPLAACVGHETAGTCDPRLPCCPHARAGSNGNGSALFEIAGNALHCVSHTGSCNCPHGGTFESVQGAVLLEADGLPAALVGHTTVCKVCGTTGRHASGSDLLEVDEA